MEEVICSHCGKVYHRTTQRINEAIKFGWKQYCSKGCQNKAKTKAKIFKCSNPECNNKVKRAPNEFLSSKRCFCSYSCSAKINNSKRKRVKKTFSEGLYYKKEKIVKERNLSLIRIYPEHLFPKN